MHVYTLAVREKRSFVLSEMTGTVVSRTSGGVILAQETGVCAFDPVTISGRRTVARLPNGETGVPDGMTIDTDSRLSVAVFSGYGVHCIDPDTGRSLEKVTVPVPKTTACWFGGDNLDELCITSASVGKDDASLHFLSLVTHPLGEYGSSDVQGVKKE